MRIDKVIIYFENILDNVSFLLSNGFGNKSEYKVLYDERKAHVEFAIQVLQEKQERDNPQPLTLEQLKQRVGKPVWCSKNKRYGIIGENRDDLEVWFCGGWEMLKDLISKPIYDYEPKENDNGK